MSSLNFMEQWETLRVPHKFSMLFLRKRDIVVVNIMMTAFRDNDLPLVPLLIYMVRTAAIGTAAIYYGTAYVAPWTAATYKSLLVMIAQ